MAKDAPEQYGSAEIPPMTGQEKVVLQAIYDHFREHGAWPTFITIDRPIRREHRWDTGAIILSLPESLIVQPRPGNLRPIAATSCAFACSASRLVTVAQTTQNGSSARCTGWRDGRRPTSRPPEVATSRRKSPPKRSLTTWVLTTPANFPSSASMRCSNSITGDSGAVEAMTTAGTSGSGRTSGASATCGQSRTPSVWRRCNHHRERQQLETRYRQRQGCHQRVHHRTTRPSRRGSERARTTALARAGRFTLCG